ncbi:FecCD family ABC transporter permease [Gryllotalpicola ginsengisoli]|uniref:FecCD family ABC transporter permease n=1 Tax=Gryllotalpicola ginsengisoli TaxID=444608 RepID=UPI0003B5C139|nr:iron chelate uptake ABC transporter family permease subunit [Gryllotalpicola ginsengisoli]
MSATTITDAAAEPAAAVRRALAAARRRHLLVLAALAAAVVLVAAVTLSVGDVGISPARLAATLVGQGDPLENLVVFTLRLPRWVTGALVGLALALAGSLFQSTLRNPLASPDVIGVSGGASLAAVAAMLVFHATGPAVPIAAFCGAAVVAAVIGLLSWREGFAGQRFVLIGIAVAFLVNGGLGYLFTRADVRDAQQALVWTVGSVNDPSWAETGLLAAVLVVLVPLAFWLARPLSVLALGDDAAHGLGVRPARTTIGAIAVGVALAASATAVAGPVAFVAFVSAPVARRLVGAGGLQPAASALTGVVLVTAADAIAAHLGDFQAPVGLVTGVIGAPYLLWLLTRTEGASA